MKTFSDVDRAKSVESARHSEPLAQLSFTGNLRARLSELPGKLAPVGPALRSLAGCFVFLGAIAPKGELQAAAQQQLPYRAQWGDPNYVVLSWKGGAQIMTYQQFFSWVGQRHPNEAGIKVVGELPAHIKGQTTPSAATVGALQHSEHGVPKSNLSQQQAWQKYQHDVAAYQANIQKYKADLARWQAYQASHGRVSSTGHNGFWRSVGSSLGESFKQLGSSLRNDPLGIRTPTAPPPLVVRQPSHTANKQSISSSTQRTTSSSRGSKPVAKMEPTRVKPGRSAVESAKPVKLKSPQSLEPAATPEVPRAVPLPSFDSGLRIGDDDGQLQFPHK